MREFYPLYLDEHRNAACRRIHVVGRRWSLVVLAAAIVPRDAWLLLLMPVVGYGFAWIGHFAFDKEPAGDLQPPALQPDGRLGDVP